MDVRDRALLDLERSSGGAGSGSAVAPRYDPLEKRFLAFKERLHRVACEALGDGYERFLDDYFLGFLPALLRTAAEHEGLDQVQCDEERALVDEVMQEKQGLLAHSSILFPLNRQMFAGVPHARPALDLGIGNARSSAFALDRTVDVGADVIHSNLVKARSRGVHEQVVSLDMAAIPYLDDTFARVYSLNAIYHVQEGRRKALEEMVRVLAPGGTLALTDVSPFLQEMKPLATFFSSLGFANLEQEFTRYFLSGYGASGTPGEEGWYRAELAGFGLRDVEVRYFMSPRLCQLGYLLYDWQALFNLDAQSRLAGPEGENRHQAAYRPALTAAIAPLVKLDRELCAQAVQTGGGGGYLFITARKEGDAAAHGESPRERLACPACRVRLEAGMTCGACLRTYPRIDGIPLVTTFYAEAFAEGKLAGARPR